MGQSPCSSISNDGLIENLHKFGYIKTDHVKEAMKKIDRKHYMTNENADDETAYDDCPQPIGHNVTISAPHMHVTSYKFIVY
jgi:protein-L-isoaspartate(D-aspartate) O-methyltransferase